ncbi:hypothetical protein FHX44_112141 [Pseudonocardia hierapolitana]|uniref:Uncharacterized protein n=1 Tax=Pseudonocardia hierapolitana TaxID=1128676 RepID=A0A561SN16_9PSEU|nr:hypothetical protein [Pseudonocardia hierapolitana]TWF76251.1 hypothetical protein FHX44_112141 [Pseudonocardia hierapolitana]
MTELMTPQTAAETRPVVRDREGTAMLLHEALARCRHQEALAAARQHALVRQFTAGRRWASLAGYAARKAARARARAVVRVA